MYLFREYLKSNFGSKKKRQLEYVKMKEKKAAEDKRKRREEIRNEKKGAIDKYKKVLEDH